MSLPLHRIRRRLRWQPPRRPFDPALVLYLPFFEGSGRVVTDESLYGNHGLAYPAPTDAVQPPSWTEGKLGPALSFDGADDYVEVPHDPTMAFTSEDFSIMLWVKSNVEGVLQMMIVKGAFNADGWELFWLSTDRLYFRTYQIGAYQHTISNLVSRDTWYHVKMVRAGSNVTIYINGVDATASHGTHLDPASSTRSMKIGIRDDKISKPFDGIINEVRVYNRALEAYEIEALYRAAV